MVRTCGRIDWLKVAGMGTFPSLAERYTNAGSRFGLADGCRMNARISASMVSASVVGIP